jgi:hypothetical protein
MGLPNLRTVAAPPHLAANRLNKLRRELICLNVYYDGFPPLRMTTARFIVMLKGAVLATTFEEDSLTSAERNTSRSDVKHIRGLPRASLRAQLGESSIIERSRNGVSLLDHERANRRRTQFVAIGAKPESRDRPAGDWNERAIENPENLGLPRRENQFFASSNVFSGGEPLVAPALRSFEND